MTKLGPKISAFALLTISLVAIFYPDIENASRILRIKDDEPVIHRGLQSAATPPAATSFSCPAGQNAVSLDWSKVKVKSGVAVQTVTFPTGHQVTISIHDVAPGKAVQWGMMKGFLGFGVEYTLSAADYIDKSKPGVYPNYPSGYSTMQFTFDRELDGLYISIGDVDSGGDGDAVRIRMYDANDQRVNVVMTKTGSVVVKNDFGFQGTSGKSANNPGFDQSLYAKANGAVKSISLDQSVFCYSKGLIGASQTRFVYPGLDFSYCSPTPSPTMAPTSSNPYVTPAPMSPTQGSSPPTLTPVIQSLVPIPPSLPPFNSGVNGDPLIMGLSGQLFYFDGRSGAWYSVVSTKSFQWNMRTQVFENCPADSNNFISGVGFTIGNRKIQVNVVNAYNVDVGCGSGTEQHCLGSGSLELIVDGVKHTFGGDYTFKDGSGRIVAFNTYHQCSRKWYDFEVRPSLELDSDLRAGRRLDQPNVFEVIDRLKKTMIDPVDCESWINDRKMYNDLFLQPGRSSTVIIETDDITLHLEYRQENERCDAHSIDVWIASISPTLLDQKWEGIIGETKKDAVSPSVEQVMTDRLEVLKFKEDKDYEVVSPFSSKCNGCYKQ